MAKILFVCNNNHSRSPMAAAYFADAGRRAGIAPLEVESAGIWGRPEEMIDDLAVEALKRRGLDPLRRGCRQLLPKLIKSADLIVCMSQDMADEVESRFISSRHKTVSLMSLSNSDTGVFDPRGGNVERYEECLAMMKPALDELAERLA